MPPDSAPSEEYTTRQSHSVRSTTSNPFRLKSGPLQDSTFYP